MNYTYIVKCKDGSFYTGWTNDLRKRLMTHNQGKGAKYTRCRLPVKLVYLEPQEEYSQALKKEYAIKHLKRCKKEHLIQGLDEVAKLEIKAINDEVLSRFDEF